MPRRRSARVEPSEVEQLEDEQLGELVLLVGRLVVLKAGVKDRLEELLEDSPFHGLLEEEP